MWPGLDSSYDAPWSRDRTGATGIARSKGVHMRIQLTSVLCLAAGLVLGAGSALAQAYDPDRMSMPPNQGDQKAREACTPDVMRLCNDYIPDVPQIVACLKAQRANLSPACGEIFAAEEPPPPQRPVKTTAKKKPEKKPDTQIAEKTEKKKPQKVGAPLSLSAAANKTTR